MTSVRPQCALSRLIVDARATKRRASSSSRAAADGAADATTTYVPGNATLREAHEYGAEHEYSR
jgi:hypothetical protein